MATATSTTLRPAIRERLIKLAGLLGSDQLGERAAAAAKASQLLKEHGLTWRDALTPGPAAPPPRPAPRKPDLAYDPDDWQEWALACWEVMQHPKAGLTEWEQQYLDDLTDRPPSWRLTKRQHHWLERIAVWLHHKDLL